VDVTVWLADKLRVTGLRLTVGPDGDTVLVRLTTSVNPFTLVTLRIDVVENPAASVMVLGLAVMAKSGVVPPLNVAPCNVSGSGDPEPLEIVAD